MNAAYETIAPESSPQASLSSENLAGDAYLKIDFAEFGYVEYKRDDPVDGLRVLGVFEEGSETGSQSRPPNNSIELALVHP
jgi:hypothetical protein